MDQQIREDNPQEGTAVPSHAVPGDVVGLEKPTESYQYDPLSEPDEIRCLVLESGTGDADEPLVCSLRHHRLADNPDFEAISYTWGNSQKTHTISCNGRRLSITMNLHTCLLQTRLRNQQRVLWADSICINQDNLEEKSRQVAIMSRIYSEARRVLICLGPEKNGHAKDAADLVSEVSKWIQTTVRQTDGGLNSFPVIPTTKWPHTDRRWRTLSSMTELSWFDRGWVVQEASLAKDARVMWGDVELSWVEVLRTISWERSRAITPVHRAMVFGISCLHFDQAYASKYPEEHSVLTARAARKSFTLLEILDCGGSLRFEKEVDRIYAFLGLSAFKDARRALVAVDYKLPYLQVYFKFSSWYIDTTHDPELLRFINHDNDTLLENIPSWVPQWDVAGHMRLRTPSTVEPIFLGSKDSNSAVLAAVQGVILRVHGMLLDRIEWTSQVLSYDTSIEEMAELWTRFEEHRNKPAYQTFSPLLAFLQAILLGAPNLAVKYHTKIANNAKYLLLLRNGKPLPPHPGLEYFSRVSKDGDATITHARVQAGLHNRRLVITARGYYGVVPSAAQEGDICCIISGVRNPCIIRKTDREGHYKVLGEAFFVSTRLPEGEHLPYGFGSGPSRNEDWLEWNLEAQEILLC